MKASVCTSTCDTPLGRMIMAGGEEGLAGLWFEGQKHCCAGLAPGCPQREIPLFSRVRAWLGAYFAGGDPALDFPLRLEGTPFQEEVWRMLLAIDRGTVTTYGEIARRLALGRGARVSAQAVGGAVGRNRISIIVPCHRVVGAGGSLTGYAGGLGRKAHLLRLEGAWQERFHAPARGTAL